MSETPKHNDGSKHNAYQVAPEHPGDEQGYHTAEPNNADEQYTAENVLKRKGESAPWGRTGKGEQSE